MSKSPESTSQSSLEVQISTPVVILSSSMTSSAASILTLSSEAQISSGSAAAFSSTKSSTIQIQTSVETQAIPSRATAALTPILSSTQSFVSQIPLRTSLYQATSFILSYPNPPEFKYFQYIYIRTFLSNFSFHLVNFCWSLLQDGISIKF